MSEDKNHSEALKRYLKGKMSPSEAHAFEREALDDPFLSEAIEGYEKSGTEALDDLQSLSDKLTPQAKKKFPWIRLAASVALLLTATFVIYFLQDSVAPKKEIAMEKAPIEETSEELADTIQVTSEDESEEVEPEPNPRQEDENTQLAIIEEPVDDSDSRQVAVLQSTSTNIDISDEDPATDDGIASGLVIETSPIQSVERKEVDLAITDQAEESMIEETDISEILQGKVASLQLEIDSSEDLGAALRSNAVIAVDASNFQNKSDSTQVQKPIRIRGIGSIPKRSRSTITGQVTDDTGEGLPGVNVVIKGTTTGTQTDFDGYYSLEKTKGMVLVFSYVGFESNEVEVGARTIIDITMGSATELQEVVTVGYGASQGSSTSFESAKPRGGNKAFKNYIKNSLRYPDAARENEIEGTVVLQLTIDIDGSISNIDIKKSLGYGCDEEAVRLIVEGPTWSAARKDGNRVEDKVRVKVKFKID